MDAVIGSEIDLVVLYAAPQAFDEDVMPPADFAENLRRVTQKLLLRLGNLINGDIKLLDYLRHRPIPFDRCQGDFRFDFR